jgi:hypothetical protein
MLAKVKAAGAEAAAKAAAAAASAAKDAASKAKDAAPGMLASAKEAASKAKDAAAGSETLQKAKSSAAGLVSAVRSRAEAIPPEDRQRYSEVATTVLTLASACGVRGAGRSVRPGPVCCLPCRHARESHVLAEARSFDPLQSGPDGIVLGARAHGPAHTLTSERPHTVSLQAHSGPGGRRGGREGGVGSRRFAHCRTRRRRRCRCCRWPENTSCRSSGSRRHKRL